MDREARFLASQAERLADNKQRQQKTSSRRNNHHQLHNNANGLSSSQNDLSNDEIIIVNDDDQNDVVNQKEEGHRFWMNFRKLCSELQSRIEILLLLHPNVDDDEGVCVVGGAAANSTANDGNYGGGMMISKNKNYDNARTYYSTATRRSEGRIQLDCLLDYVRSLRRHCLSSSSSMMNAAASENRNNDDTSTINQLLSNILSTPMPEMTQTDMRILSEEMDRLLKCIDEARTIISPTEKFVFRRYRQAMEGKRLLDGEKSNGLEGGMDAVRGSGAVSDNLEGPSSKLHDDGNNTCKETNEQQDTNEALFHHDGGVLENKRDCTIEIYSNGNIKVNEMTETQLQCYRRPRRINNNSLHPPPTFNNIQQLDTTTTTASSSSSSSSMSYLLQNLTNVTILLHGSRPSLHIKNIHNCHIYVTEPTLGPVHLTNCHSSEIRCSCYQLRIHDSIHVTFHVWVRSGPIIENCKGMVFGGDYFYLDDDDDNNNSDVVEKNMYWDVKDFNWLRTLRKSPNFVVVVAAAADVTEDDSDAGDGRMDGKVVSDKEDVGPRSVSVQDDSSPLHEEEEDSDDEL